MVARRSVLIKAGFVGFIDNNKSKVFEGRKKGGTWANDDKGRGLISLVDALPNEVTFSFGELGMQRNHLSTKMLLKTTN